MVRLPFDADVAGVDEAGRGPIAGPLVVAAVLLPAGFDTQGIDDSKRLTAARREALCARITASADCAVVVVPVSEIDRLNILRATLRAMSESIRRLGVLPSLALIDGNAVPVDPPCAVRTVVKGDGKHAAIAAASIVAKVTRDRLMTELDLEHPGYGFADHFGYHCTAHIQALGELGPCAAHRRSFEPVKSMVNQPCLMFEN